MASATGTDAAAGHGPGPEAGSIARRALLLLALLAGNAALALGPWFVRLADTGPVSAGFWRLALPIPLFVALAWRERRGQALPDRHTAWLLVLAGTFFALDLASWHVGIEATRLGNAVLFGNAGSVVLMVWGLATLRRAPAGHEWLALVAALGGAGLLLGRSLQVSTATFVGDLFCLAAGLFYAVYLLPAQSARRSLGPWTVLALVCCSGAPVLLGIALLLGEPVWPGDWTPVLALALSSQIIGQGLLVFSLRHFGALVIGVALLTQPAIAATVGYFAFRETLAGWDVLGMAMVAAALVLARLGEGRGGPGKNA